MLANNEEALSTIKSLFPTLSRSYTVQIGNIPSEPYSIGILRSTGGSSTSFFGQSEDIQKPSVLIRVTCERYEIGQKDCATLFNTLKKVALDNCTIQTVGDFFHLGKDESNRHIFNITLKLQIF